MPKIIKISAIFLFALGVTAPAQASDNWFSNLFPWLTSPIHAETTGGGAGGGDPGVDPTASTTGVGSGGGNPGVDPNFKALQPVNNSSKVYIPLGPGGGHPGVDPE